MLKFKELFESKDSVGHKGYTITYVDGEDGEYLFVSKGKEFIGSIDLTIGENGIHEDLRELTRTKDADIEKNKKLQALIKKYA